MGNHTTRTIAISLFVLLVLIFGYRTGFERTNSTRTNPSLIANVPPYHSWRQKLFSGLFLGTGIFLVFVGQFWELSGTINAAILGFSTGYIILVGIFGDHLFTFLCCLAFGVLLAYYSIRSQTVNCVASAALFGSIVVTILSIAFYTHWTRRELVILAIIGGFICGSMGFVLPKPFVFASTSIGLGALVVTFAVVAFGWLSSNSQNCLASVCPAVTATYLVVFLIGTIVHIFLYRHEQELHELLKFWSEARSETKQGVETGISTAVEASIPLLDSPISSSRGYGTLTVLRPTGTTAGPTPYEPTTFGQRSSLRSSLPVQLIPRRTSVVRFASEIVCETEVSKIEPSQ
eukprot:TRINITY_DN2887_c0_g2_i2.p1 TRINITY_DN2887_c0_g2~~TRINITY_DN2887_c0_g2_i2.p1  ORF type:complete len:347 (-),score=34.74 TRINITY_DN2887_c0_g2_i2:283-1323(-)